METFTIILLTAVVAVCANVTPQESATEPVQIPKPTITGDPSHAVLYKSETITLHCRVSGGATALQYDWYRDSKDLNEHQSDISVKENGKYECKAKSGASESENSDSYTLTLQDPPKAKVIVTPNLPEFYPGEKIKLQCGAEDGSPGWTFQWMKNGQKLEQKGDLTITVNHDHSGKYTCTGKLDREVTTKESDAFQLNVKDPPKAKLTVSPDRPEFYTGEKIQLQCEIEGDSSGWTIEWMKNDWSSKNVATRTITAGHSESGKYTCKGKLDNREVTTQQSNAFQLKVKDPPKAKLTVSPGWPEFYTGEQVSLQCGAEDLSSGWTFQWMKNGQKYQDGGANTITVKNADSGKYTCTGKLEKREVTTQESDAFELTVKDPPKAKLTVSSEWTEFYTGEEIKLHCGAEDGSSGWTFQWMRNGKNMGNSIELPLILNKAHSGAYTCKGNLGNRPVTTQESDAYQLKVKDPPKAKVTVTPKWPEFYTGEKITLQCGAEDASSGWTFQWMKNGEILGQKSDFPITVNHAHSGNYTCTGQLDRQVKTKESDAFQLNVKDRPKAKLTVRPVFNAFYPGEEISLQCGVEDGSLSWTFQLMKNNQELGKNGALTTTVEHTDSGEYTCEGKLNEREVTARQSDTFQFNVKDIPKPKLTVDPKWNEFFPNEKISLQCGIQDGPSGWTFQWTRHDQMLENDKFSLEFDVNHADSGGYACTGKLKNREVTTQKSDAFQLNVKENWPKPSLNRNLDVPVIYAGEHVTISCEVNVQSPDWEFLWYKDSDNINPASSKHSIRHAGVSDSGNYRCQVRRRGLTSFMSDPHNLTVEERPKAQVELQWAEAFVGETMSLQCMIEAGSEQWSYKWFKGSEEIVSSDGKMIKGNTLILSYVVSSHQGPYACQAELPDRKVKTDKSETESLTVHDLSPAVLTLETELNDIVAGEMTLKCEVSDDRQWNYTWYENGQTLNGSSQQLKVPANEETIKSEFKCKGIRTERPLISAVSDGFTANNILFKRKILLAISGFVVCCIVILIIGCVVLKVTRKPEKKEAPQEDLFFSMVDSKNQTASPLKEYMDDIPTEKKECEEKEELLTDRASVVHEDGVVKDEDKPAAGANGMTSFKGD